MKKIFLLLLLIPILTEAQLIINPSADTTFQAKVLRSKSLLLVDKAVTFRKFKNNIFLDSVLSTDKSGNMIMIPRVIENESFFKSTKGSRNLYGKVSFNNYGYLWDSLTDFKIRDTGRSNTGKKWGSLFQVNKGLYVNTSDSNYFALIKVDPVTGLEMQYSDQNNQDTNYRIKLNSGGLKIELPSSGPNKYLMYDSSGYSIWSYLPTITPTGGATYTGTAPIVVTGSTISFDKTADYAWTGLHSFAKTQTIDVGTQAGGYVAQLVRANNTNLIKIFANGNIGVGVDPSYKLDVYGDLNIMTTNTSRYMRFIESLGTLYMKNDANNTNIIIAKPNTGSSNFISMQDNSSGGYINFGSGGSSFSPSISLSAGTSSDDFSSYLIYTRDQSATPAFNIDARTAGGTLTTQPLFSISSYANEKFKIKANGNIISSSLKTTLTAPTTVGTVKMVVTDTTGQLSFQNIPSYAGGDNYIPLSGTLPNKPLTGTIVADPTNKFPLVSVLDSLHSSSDNNIGAFIDSNYTRNRFGSYLENYAENSNNHIYTSSTLNSRSNSAAHSGIYTEAFDSSASAYMYATSSIGGVSKIMGVNFNNTKNPGIILYDDYGQGLKGGSYFGAKYDSLTYVQKKYVDSLHNASGGDYIPLAGTLPNKPLTGAIVADPINKFPLVGFIDSLHNSSDMYIGAFADSNYKNNYLGSYVENYTAKNSNYISTYSALNSKSNITTFSGLYVGSIDRVSQALLYAYAPDSFQVGKRIGLTINNDKTDHYIVVQDDYGKGLVGDKYFGAKYDSLTYVQKKYVDSLHNAAGTGGTTVDTTSLSNRINKNTTNIATNATDITTKLNITDTANIRLRPIAGTNTTIIGTYPNLIFNSSGIDTAKNYTWTGQHIFSNLNFTIGGTSSIGTNFRIYGPGAPADGNWSALWNQGYAPSINFGSYSYFVDLKYGAGNNIRLNRSSNYYGSRSGVQIGKGDDTLRGIIDIAAGSSRMPPISINIPTALTDSARKGSIEVVGDSLFYTGNTSIRKKVLRTGDDQRKSISVSVNYAVTSEIRVVNATSSVAITIQSPSLYLDQEITIINSSSGNVFVASANNSSIGNFNVSNIYTIPSDGSVTFHSNGTKYLISAH